MPNKGKTPSGHDDQVVDLSSRIGARGAERDSRDAGEPRESHPPRLDAPLPPRRAPEPRAPGDTDLVVTGLATIDDGHRFEQALRALPGVGQVTTEYYRHGALKLRVSHDGPQRLSQALRSGVPGFRVRVTGEGPSTLQVLASPENEERTPG